MFQSPSTYCEASIQTRGLPTVSSNLAEVHPRLGPTNGNTDIASQRFISNTFL